MRIVRLLAAATAAFAYLLVALSPIVRITGSGMGCGDHWPLCNGRLIPRLDNLAVMIEWGHRMAVVGLTALVLALLAGAWAFRRQPGVAGPGGVLRPATLAAVLLVVQSLLGAVTVWLELPAGVVVVHLLNAMALLAAAWAFRRQPGVAGPGSVLRPAMLAGVLLVVQSLLGAVTVWLELPAGVVVIHLLNAMALLAAALVAAARAFERQESPREPADARVGRSALVGAALAGLALLLGGLTANLHAGTACQGFPLCNGRLWPSSGGGLAVLHWTHRLVAYALALHLLGMIIAVRRRRQPARIVIETGIALGVLAFHVAVAAAMVGLFLPLGLRVAHAALGTLVWAVLVHLVRETGGGRAPAAA